MPARAIQRAVNPFGSSCSRQNLNFPQGCYLSTRLLNYSSGVQCKFTFPLMSYLSILDTNQEKKPKDESEESTAAKKKTPDILSMDKGEHPLSEFEEEKLDPSLAPPLHAADTPHVPYQPERLSEEEVKTRAREFYEQMNKRRSVREFSSKPVPVEAIKSIVHAAGTSPSGAHSEPWTFVVVGDPKLKSQIRDIIEQV